MVACLREVKDGKNHKGFKLATSNFDYKKTTLVARELISAIERFKRFEMFNAGEDLDNATSNLKEAGTLAYQAIEHAYVCKYWGQL